ncbi:MAG: hypothetical protein OXN89_16155 [Bryobacterales bacterium]|nr:hypothetical protein [Bryobacterales bacterium]
MPTVTPQPDEGIELGPTPSVDLGPDQKQAVVHRAFFREFVRISVYGDLAPGGRGAAVTTGEDGSEGGSQGGESGRSDDTARGRS